MSDDDLITRGEMLAHLRDLAAQVNDGFATIHERHSARLGDIVEQVNAGFTTHATALGAIGTVAGMNAARGALGLDSPNVTLNIEPGAIQVTNDVHPAEVTLPARRTSTFVERDERGLIVETTTVETDAPVD